MKVNRTYFRYLSSNIIVGLISMSMMIPIIYNNIQNYQSKIMNESYQRINEGFNSFTRDMERINGTVSMINKSTIYSQIARLPQDYQVSDYLDICQLQSYVSSILFPYKDIIYDYIFTINNSNIVITENRVFLENTKMYPVYFSFSDISEEEYYSTLFKTTDIMTLQKSKLCTTIDKGTKDVIDYVFPIRTRSGENQVVLEILLDSDAIYQKYFNTIMKDKSEVILLNASKDIIYSNIEDQNKIDRFKQTSTYMEKHKNDKGINEVIFSVSSDKLQLQLKVIHDLNIYTSELRQIFWLIGCYLLLTITVSILMSLFIAFRQYKPIESLVRLVQAQSHAGIKNEVKDDYEEIRSHFLQALKDKDMLTSNMDQIRRNLRHLSFSQLLLSPDYKVEDPELFKELPSQYIGVSVMGQKTGGRLLDIFDPLIRRVKIEPFCVHEISSENLFFMVDASVLDIDALKEVVTNLVTEAVNGINRLYCGISEIHHGEEEINAAYRQCVFSLHFRGKAEIILKYQSFQSISATEFLRPNWKEHLVEMLSSADNLGVNEELSNILIKTVQVKPDPRTLQYIYTEIMAVCVLVSDKHRLQTDLAIFEEVNFTQSIFEVFDKFSLIVQRINDSILGKRKSSNVELRDKILLYIKENFSNENLYTRTVADKFDISEKYLSAFIKEQTGFGFSEYVEKLRLDYARELIQNSSYSIKRIGEMSGFNNQSTFYKSFNRIYGIAPGELRKSVNNEVK